MLSRVQCSPWRLVRRARGGLGWVMALCLLLHGALPVRAEDVSTEYQVKAAFLFIFVKFVEWPDGTLSDQIDICVAGANPFGETLGETLRGEELDGRPISWRTISQPDASCHVLFVPSRVGPRPFLRAAQSRQQLTVGESPTFLADGGIINFVIEENRVRFEISPAAASRAGLRISSRLLQLARIRQP
jgi:hypothetical protein